ncbi:DUF3017 domain-containing protein [Modestobacter sp. VKM Ac-2983]|uniref:DUF3017 domain-containing protein n=1 Tax=Modestobacter sp. VKM Ac-2983 TaxID=3004137 RepID=UPI0022AB8873|nr:DUF3017 domain-containing protein [Modestobacter sp. VKM Ac-2983]MCZ2806410.1 DUF3017 domain-containing protein [Modestobacter sp. VKM Ac-2983]
MIRPARGTPPTRPPLYLRRPLLAGFLRQWPLLAVIVVAGAGLLLVSHGRWRLGLVVMGFALIAAATLRLLLPLRRIGFLAVRSQRVDVTLTGVAGVALAVIALLIPAP